MTKLLKLTDVNLNYNTDNNLINVLQDVSFEVDYKETISVVGESGSGKTSLIMLIGGLEKASSGKIEFKDFEISSLKEDQITTMMSLSGVKEFPMRVKCATMAWHTLSNVLEIKKK